MALQLSAEAAKDCLTTCGGFVFAREYDSENKGREARLSGIASISLNLMFSFVGQRVPGVPKSG